MRLVQQLIEVRRKDLLFLMLTWSKDRCLQRIDTISCFLVGSLLPFAAMASISTERALGVSGVSFKF